MAEIIKVGKEVLAIQDYQPKDLSDPAKANAFVKLYAEKKKAAEIAELEYEAMKEEAARLTEEYTDNGTPVSVYGMEEQKKVCREFARKEAVDITEDFPGGGFSPVCAASTKRTSTTAAAGLGTLSSRSRAPSRCPARSTRRSWSRRCSART